MYVNLLRLGRDAEACCPASVYRPCVKRVDLKDMEIMCEHGEPVFDAHIGKLKQTFPSSQKCAINLDRCQTSYAVFAQFFNNSKFSRRLAPSVKFVFLNMNEQDKPTSRLDLFAYL